MEAVLDPLEELVLNEIKKHWERDRRKLSIMQIRDMLDRKGLSLSHEKVRLVIESLWRKGEVLIDVRGRERIVRPNHVIVNSRSRPLDFRNFTILDESGRPVQRIWVSIYKDEKGEKYVSISESRWNGSWKTTNHIIIPPEAGDEIRNLATFLLVHFKGENGGEAIS